MNTKNYLLNKKHIHLIGIGGSGMFPIAQILHGEGFFLTGSDNNQTDTLDLVRDMGIEVFMGQSSDNIKGADLIVYSAAIMDTNIELLSAKNSGVDTIERSVLLGLLSTRKDNAICVSGTHGKTTTSSMIATIMLKAKLDPTCLIGGKLKVLGGSGRAGKSENMILEACEFNDTFLKLSPDVAVIINVDEDHLDYFKNLDNIIKSFRTFASKATNLIIINGDDENSQTAVSGLDKKVIRYGTDASFDYCAKNIKYNSDGFFTTYDLYYNKEFFAKICLSVPGEHNIHNSMGAIAAAVYSGASTEDCVAGIKEFAGAGRRFEILDTVNDITVADDYAHHPLEIKLTLESAKRMPHKRVIAIHQPFTFSRTNLFLKEFAESLSIADLVVLSPIMGSREVNTFNIHSEDLCALTENCTKFDTFDEIANHVVSIVKPGDLVITLGCGDINKVAHSVVDTLKAKF